MLRYASFGAGVTSSVIWKLALSQVTYVGWCYGMRHFGAGDTSRVIWEMMLSRASFGGWHYDICYTGLALHHAPFRDWHTVTRHLGRWVLCHASFGAWHYVSRHLGASVTSRVTSRVIWGQATLSRHLGASVTSRVI